MQYSTINHELLELMNRERKREQMSVEYPYISKTLLVLFCGYVVIWYLQIGYRFPALGAIRFEFLYASALTLFAVLFTPKIDTKFPLLPLIVLYVIILVIQIPFSYDLNTSWNVFVNRIVKFAFFSFFIVCFVRSPTHLKYFLAAFLLACFKMGQEGLTGRLTGGLIWENQEIMRLHGSTPNYMHPNSFAGMALGTLPFIYYLWPLYSKYIKIFLFVLALLSLNIIIYTGSRTGYIGIIALIVYVFMLSKSKKIFLTRCAFVSLVAISIIPSEYYGRFDSIFADKEHEGGSISTRKVILADAIEIFLENPFGIGVSAFPKKRMDTFGRSQDTHNLYLEIATNLGIQGLIVFALLIYNLLLMLHKIKTFAKNMIGKILNDNQQSSAT